MCKLFQSFLIKDLMIRKQFSVKIKNYKKVGKSETSLTRNREQELFMILEKKTKVFVDS